MMDRERELELKAIITCEQSDGYLKEWARKELGRLKKKKEVIQNESNVESY